MTMTGMKDIENARSGFEFHNPVIAISMANWTLLWEVAEAAFVCGNNLFTKLLHLGRNERRWHNLNALADYEGRSFWDCELDSCVLDPKVRNREGIGHDVESLADRQIVDVMMVPRLGYVYLSEPGSETWSHQVTHAVLYQGERKNLANDLLSAANPVVGGEISHQESDQIVKALQSTLAWTTVPPRVVTAAEMVELENEGRVHSCLGDESENTESLFHLQSSFALRIPDKDDIVFFYGRNDTNHERGNLIHGAVQLLVEQGRNSEVLLQCAKDKGVLSADATKPSPCMHLSLTGYHRDVPVILECLNGMSDAIGLEFKNLIKQGTAVAASIAYNGEHSEDFEVWKFLMDCIEKSNDQIEKRGQRVRFKCGHNTASPTDQNELMTALEQRVKQQKRIYEESCRTRLSFGGICKLVDPEASDLNKEDRKFDVLCGSAAKHGGYFQIGAMQNYWFRALGYRPYPGDKGLAWLDIRDSWMRSGRGKRAILEGASKEDFEQIFKRVKSLTEESVVSEALTKALRADEEGPFQEAWEYDGVLVCKKEVIRIPVTWSYQARMDVWRRPL